MINQSSNFPGIAAPQAQLARLKKKLTNLSEQLDGLSGKADLSHNQLAKARLSRARANAITALSLNDAVETIARQSALDLLIMSRNDVQINIAVTACEDVPDINNLKSLATASAVVVLPDEEMPDKEMLLEGAAGLHIDQPKRFSCFAPDPQKWFREGKTKAVDNGLGNQAATTSGADTGNKTAYLLLTIPVDMSPFTERVAEFLKLSEALLAAAKTQLGEARESICHAAGEDTCSLF